MFMFENIYSRNYTFYFKKNNSNNIIDLIQIEGIQFKKNGIIEPIIFNDSRYQVFEPQIPNIINRIFSKPNENSEKLESSLEISGKTFVDYPELVEKVTSFLRGKGGKKHSQKLKKSHRRKKNKKKSKKKI